MRLALLASVFSKILETCEFSIDPNIIIDLSQYTMNNKEKFPKTPEAVLKDIKMYLEINLNPDTVHNNYESLNRIIRLHELNDIATHCKKNKFMEDPFVLNTTEYLDYILSVKKVQDTKAVEIFTNCCLKFIKTQKDQSEANQDAMLAKWAKAEPSNNLTKEHVKDLIKASLKQQAKYMRYLTTVASYHFLEGNFSKLFDIFKIFNWVIIKPDTWPTLQQDKDFCDFFDLGGNYSDINSPEELVKRLPEKIKLDDMTKSVKNQLFLLYNKIERNKDFTSEQEVFADYLEEFLLPYIQDTKKKYDNRNEVTFAEFLTTHFSEEAEDEKSTAKIETAPVSTMSTSEGASSGSETSTEAPAVYSDKSDEFSDNVQEENKDPDKTVKE